MTITAPTYQVCTLCGGPVRLWDPAGMCNTCVGEMGFQTTGDAEPGTTEWEQGREPFDQHERGAIRRYELAINHIPDMLAGGHGIVERTWGRMLNHAFAYAYRLSPGVSRSVIRDDLELLAEWNQALNEMWGVIPVRRLVDRTAINAYGEYQERQYHKVAHAAKDAALARLLHDGDTPS